MLKNMSLHGQSNYHQSFPNLTWPNNACDVMQKCGSLVANVQPDSCNMTRMFGLKFLIYLYLFEQECKQI